MRSPNKLLHATPQGAAREQRRPNLNEGKPWFEIVLVDLRNALAHDRPVAEIADLLCRREREVGEKIADSGDRRQDPKLDCPTGDDPTDCLRAPFPSSAGGAVSVGKFSQLFF